MQKKVYKATNVKKINMNALRQEVEGEDRVLIQSSQKLNTAPKVLYPLLFQLPQRPIQPTTENVFFRVIFLLCG